MSSTEPQRAQPENEAQSAPQERRQMSFDMKVVLVIVGVLFLAFVVGGLF